MIRTMNKRLTKDQLMTEYQLLEEQLKDVQSKVNAGWIFGFMVGALIAYALMV
jgi:hypothetical protein